MRVLLDECVPQRLARGLTGHDVSSVQQMGWSGERNGELLALMKASGFAALVTVDRNLQYQQNLTATGISVVLIVARTNRIKRLMPLAPKVCDALAGIRAGEFIRIGE